MHYHYRHQASHEIRECFEVTKVEGDQALFPDKFVPGMRPALTGLAKQSRELTFRLLRSIALSLGQEKDYFVKCHQIFTPNGISKLRSIYYPPINGTIVPGVVRCGEHSGPIVFKIKYTLTDGSNKKSRCFFNQSRA